MITLLNKISTQKKEQIDNNNNLRDLCFQHKGAYASFDMNVIPAWRKGYTGKDIVVTILDDGIEHDHPDIIENYVSFFMAQNIIAICYLF